MMDLFTVALFGHRKLDDLQRTDDALSTVIRGLLKEKEYVSFLIGRNGEFDEYAASVIKRVQKELGKENSDLILVLPYTVADIGYYKNYYDDIIIPDCTHGVHPKGAIAQKNRWMVEQSDLVLVNVSHDKGGAYTATKYAERMNKKIINLTHTETLDENVQPCEKA